MRIAYLHYLLPDDTALHHVRQFAAAARELGHEVEVHAMNLAPRAPGGEDPADAMNLAPGGQTAAPPRRAGLGQRLRAAAKRRFGRYLHEPKELAWNLRYYRRELALLAALDPDVVLVRDHALTASAVPAAARLGLPLVFELNAPARELELYFDEYFHLPRAAEWLEGWKLRHADAVTVVSGALKQHLVSRHRVPARRITVVPNGADLQAFRPDVPPDREARRELGLGLGLGPEPAPGLSFGPELGAEMGQGPGPQLGPVIGFVGSFQKFHGGELLAEMALRVAAGRPRVRFLLAGSGPEAAAVARRLAPLGRRVLMTGRVPHERVPRLVASFDIGVLPDTSFYACPLKIVEWMAAGRAVVAPRYGPVEELLEDGVQGLLFAPRDLGDLVAAVLRLVDHPRLARELGQAAALRARGSLGWSDNARRVAGVLEEAMGRPAASGLRADLSPAG
jgi:glycosyltransferase involved in cell wall biosynthesis